MLEKLALDEILADSLLSEQQRQLDHRLHDEQNIEDDPVVGGYDRAVAHHAKLVSSARSKLAEAFQELQNVQSKMNVGDTHQPRNGV